jgi:hypothetical protein
MARKKLPQHNKAPASNKGPKKVRKKKPQRIEPPVFKSGEWEPEYKKTAPLYTVTLDHGAFLFAWEWANRKQKWLDEDRHTYLGETLRDVSTRANDAFISAYKETTGAPAPKRGPKKRKVR